MAGITKWYVVHTYSGYENKVQDNIKKVVDNRNMNDQILDVRVPTELVVEVKDNGETKEVERKVFPGYVLVKVAVEAEDNEYVMSDDAWYVIRNTRGVTGFVGKSRTSASKTKRQKWRPPSKSTTKWETSSASPAATSPTTPAWSRKSTPRPVVSKSRSPCSVERLPPTLL